MINETKYMRQQITNLIQIIDTIKYNTLMTDWNIQTHIYKFNQIVTNELNKFKGFETSYIIANVVTLIALKREVAVEAKAFAGFPWSECQVVKTGDKSLYEYTIY